MSRLLASLITCALATTLAACSPDTAPTASDKTPTTDAASSTPSPSEKPEPQPGDVVDGMAITYKAKQALIKAGGTYAVTTTNTMGSGEASTSTGAGSLTGDQLSLRIEGDGMEFMRVGLVDMWAREAGADWERPEEMEPELGELVSALMVYGFYAADLPNQTSGVAASPAMTVVAAEDIGGVPTTHYSGQASQPDFVARHNPANYFEDHYVESEPVQLDVWVDDQGRIVKYSEVATVHAGEGTVQDVIVAEYSGFGDPVTIEAPA